MTAPTFDHIDDPKQYEAWGINPPVGFHFHVPAEIYFSWDAMSNSQMKPLARSPGHYQHSLLYPWEGSKSADMGTATDLALLDDVTLVARQFSTTPFPEPRKKNGEPYSNWLVSTGGKQWKADMDEAGITVFSVAEAFQVFGMVLAVRSSAEAMALIRGAKTQMAIVWDHPLKDDHEGEVVRCKARLDLLCGWDDGPPYLPADLKTTSAELAPLSDADPFARQAGLLHYDRQGGHYCDGLTVLTGVEHRDFRIIAVEQAAPHPVQVYRIQETDLIAAQMEIDDLLTLYKDCLDSGHWPCSVSPTGGRKYHHLAIPHWVRR